MRQRAGLALLEVLIATAVSSVVLGIAIVLMETQGAAARTITTRSERNEAARSAVAALRAELRNAGSADIHAIARDSISARIYRGLAIVCGFNGVDVFVRYEGLRLPDPAKDSAIQLGPENVVTMGSIRTDTTACALNTGEQILAVRWRGSPRVGSAWLIFETGSYHLSSHALRYREAGSTRQPVTNEVFDDARSAFVAVSDTMLRGLEVGFQDRYAPSITRARVRFVNAR